MKKAGCWNIFFGFEAGNQELFDNINKGIKVEQSKKVMKWMKEEGISTTIYYPVPLHKMKVFEDRCRVNGDLSQSGQAVNDVMSLPI